MRAPCRAQAAIAVCSKIASNMTRGVGWAGALPLQALPLPRACLHCHMLLCRILHRALFVISSTYGNSSTAWHLERLDLALNQAQTNTHLGQCSLLLTIPTSLCCLEQEKLAGSTACPFQLKALYFSILSYPSPIFYFI